MKNRKALPNTLKSLPGWVIPQWVRRGRKMHGPYYYHFQRVGGKLRKRYIPAAEVSRYRELCARWKEDRNAEIAVRKAMKSNLAEMRDLLTLIKRGIQS